MRNVLVLAAATGGRLDGERAGDLFDQALIEIVGVLDVPLGAANILIPWSTDLSPIAAAAIVDTAPTFDPEGGLRREAPRSGFIPYLPPGAEWSEDGIVFFRSSHLFLERDAPMSFEAALRQHPPTDVVVLAWTEDFAQLRDLLRNVQRVVTFGSLTPPERIASGLGIQFSQVIDLEHRLIPFDEATEIPRGSEFADERGRDADLEPYIPFGLLIQDYFDTMLPDDEGRSFHDDR